MTPRALPLLALLLAGVGPGCTLINPVRRPDHHDPLHLESGLVVQDLYVPDDLPEGNPTVRPDSEVIVHYAMWLGDGPIVDSSFDRGVPIEFRLGEGLVPAGFEEGLLGMRRAGLRSLVVPPALGYGEEGIPGSVPPDSTLVFWLELIEVR